MMTLIQLGNRLCRRLKVNDLHTLVTDDAQEVLDAINGALMDFFMLAPFTYRQRKNVHYSIHAPLQLQVTATNGSKQVSGVTAEHIGKSIQISGDEGINKIDSLNTLQAPFAGASGAAAATIYSDVLILGEDFSRFVGQPLLISAGSSVRALTRQNDEMSFLGEAPIGSPVRFVVEARGQAAGVSPSYLMRLVPIPASACGITATMEVRPKQFKLPELTSDTVIPVAPEHALAILYPIALGRLATGQLWPQGEDNKGVMADAERAVSLLQRIPADSGPSFNRVKTPYNY
jgi:hypothetical protein